MAPSPDVPTPLDPPVRFDAIPYRPEGGYTLYGLFLTTVFSITGGVLAGILAAWLGQFFYLIFVFPIAIVIIAGGSGALAARWGKLRHHRLAVAIGIASGCVAMATMHYFEFRHFLVEADKANPGAIDLQFSVTAFNQFVDLCAEAGVRIAGRGDKGINLGYYGSYIYWTIEFLFVAFFSGGFVAMAASAPFCSACNTWKVKRPLGKVDMPREVALHAIAVGEIIHLASRGLSNGPGRLSLVGAVCPNCGPSVPVDISFMEVTIDQKGNPSQSEIARVTYPGVALELLETVSKVVPVETPGIPETAGARSRPQSTILLRPVNATHPDDTWALEVHDEMVLLIDSEDKVSATIRRNEARPRLVFPSFCQSVRNLGVLTDQGFMVWFKPDKSAVKQIRSAFHL